MLTDTDLSDSLLYSITFVIHLYASQRLSDRLARPYNVCNAATTVGE